MRSAKACRQRRTLELVLQIEQYTNRYKWCTLETRARSQRELESRQAESYISLTKSKFTSLHCATNAEKEKSFQDITIASVKSMAFPFVRFSPITPDAIRFFILRFLFWQLVAPCHVVVVWTMTNILLPLLPLLVRAPRSSGECDMGKKSWKKSLRDFSLLARWPQGETFSFPTAFTGRWSPGL